MTTLHLPADTVFAKQIVELILELLAARRVQRLQSLIKGFSNVVDFRPRRRIDEDVDLVKDVWVGAPVIWIGAPQKNAANP